MVNRVKISFAQLRYLCAVAELGSFSKAAKSCEVSQPTISNAIAQLEEQLGGKLFTRSTRQLSLTPFGQHLLPLALTLLAGEQEFIREAEVFHNPPEKLLRVGFSPLIGSKFLAGLFEPFLETYPNVELVYKECAVDDMEVRLDEHRIDVIFTARVNQKSRRRSVVFHREAMIYLPCGGLSAKDKLRWGTGVSLEEAAKQLLVLTRGDCGLAETTRYMFHRRGLRPKEYRGEAISYRVLEEWSELGIGAAILPRSCLSQGYQDYPQILDNNVPVKLAYRAIWNHDTLQPKHVKDFIKYIKSSIPKLIRGDAQNSVDRFQG